MTPTMPWLPLDGAGDDRSAGTLGRLVGAIASGRDRLAAACQQRQQTLERMHTRLAGAEALERELGRRVADVSAVNRHGTKALDRARDLAGRARQDDAVARRLEVAGLSQPSAVMGRIDSALSAARRAVQDADRGFLGRRKHLRRAADGLAIAEFARVVQRDVVARVRDERDQARSELERMCTEESARLRGTVESLLAAHGEALALVRPVGAPGWPSASWSAWEPPDEVQPVHLGWLRAAPDDRLAEFASLPDARVSVNGDIRRLGGLLVCCQDSTRGEAIAAVRGLITRLLAAVPPGKARFTFFDPQGLGQAVSPFLGLADYDPKLIDGKVWSKAEDLRARLADLTGHIEQVIQKYLRGEYDDIEEYNADAGEIAEPYRILVVFDFPGQFDDTTLHQLTRVIENGPRCGVFTVVVANADGPAPYGVSIDGLPATLPVVEPGRDVTLRRGDWATAPMNLRLDDDPLAAAGEEAGQAIIDRIVHAVGRAGRGADDVTVTFERSLALYGEVARSGTRSDVPELIRPVVADDPATWWSSSSVDAMCAPLGQKGARDVAVLRFDSEIRSGALLVGRPGAGKSTLLHSYISGLCTLYDPDEVELYLIDFKEGVEFKAYAESELPHARCVAVESEREFGLSVLESIVAEMRRRAELIRGTGGQQTSFARVRQAVPARLPRLLLVFDEFHVLFSDDDRLGATAADHLETIIRQGRGFGVHVLLGSQSLSGLDALGRHVLQLLPIRMLLPSSESDAAVVLGDRNDAWKLLSRRGEGILNDAGGAVEANEPFQTAFQTEDERLARLARLRAHADSRGFLRRPIVFEGYAAARLDGARPADVAAEERSGDGGLRLRIGAPMALAGPVVGTLRRESGANALVVAKPTSGIPLALLVSTVVSALASQRGLAVHIVDFTSIDEGVEDALGPLLEMDSVAIARRRQSEPLLASLAAEVTRRVSEDDLRSPPVLLVLYGLHRARDLDASRSESFFGGDDEGPDLLGPLKEVLVDGPEYGVHTLAWADSLPGLSRRLPPGLQREFSLRIAGPMSRDDSVDFIDVDAAASCRSHQVVVLDDVSGAARRATTYAVPDTEWLRSYRDALVEMDR